MTFQEWLSKRSRTGSVKGKIIELLRQSPDPEKLILNLKDGKIKGVTKVEWEASRRIVWDFGKAGGVWSDGVRARADRTPAEPGSYADGGPMDGTERGVEAIHASSGGSTSPKPAVAAPRGSLANGGGIAEGLVFQPAPKVQRERWVAGYMAMMEAAFGMPFTLIVMLDAAEADDDPV